MAGHWVFALQLRLLVVCKRNLRTCCDIVYFKCILSKAKLLYLMCRQCQRKTWDENIHFCLHLLCVNSNRIWRVGLQLCHTTSNYPWIVECRKCPLRFWLRRMAYLWRTNHGASLGNCRFSVCISESRECACTRARVCVCVCVRVCVCEREWERERERERESGTYSVFITLTHTHTHTHTHIRTHRVTNTTSALSFNPHSGNNEIKKTLWPTLLDCCLTFTHKRNAPYQTASVVESQNTHTEPLCMQSPTQCYVEDGTTP